MTSWLHLVFSFRVLNTLEQIFYFLLTEDLPKQENLAYENKNPTETNLHHVKVSSQMIEHSRPFKSLSHCKL